MSYSEYFSNAINNKLLHIKIIIKDYKDKEKEEYNYYVTEENYGEFLEDKMDEHDPYNVIFEKDKGLTTLYCYD